MSQISDVQFRAEKEYKNSRDKFSLLLREIISNSIHAVLIRQSKEQNFIPNIKLSIIFDDNQCKIILEDNGEGFNENNRDCFVQLDKRNKEKIDSKFHPLGQGRLAIVYFSDSALYETVYKSNDGVLKKMNFTYPKNDNEVFSLPLFDEVDSQETDTYTLLTLTANKQSNHSRANTFFRKYSNGELFKNWFIENFFPFIVNNVSLNVTICFNSEKPITIQKNSLESETKSIPFDVVLPDSQEKSKFILWLIKRTTPMSGNNTIKCFARNLMADTVARGLIKSANPESESRKFVSYLPFYA